MHAERPVPRRRRAPGRQPHDDRSRQAALPEPRDLQGHPRRQGARRLQRQDHRAQRRAEDRRQADQPRAAALRRRDDQHQAAARDLRRRREVHARRGDRPARRGRDLLPARARPDLPRGARHADPRLCRRDPRPRQDRAAARGARSGALRAAGAGPRGDRRAHDAGRRTTRADSSARRRAGPGGLPDPRPAGSRQAAGLSRQRGDDAEAAGACSTRSRSTTPSTTPTCIAACTSSASGDRGLRGRAEKVARVLQRAERRARSSSRATRTEGINLVAHAFGRSRVGGRRRGPHLGDGAPLEHRAVAAALRGERRAAARRADGRPRRAAARRARGAADASGRRSSR